MRINIDRDRCTALGICESVNEDIFLVDDDGDLELLQEHVVDEADVEDARKAVANCPNMAISLTED